MLSCFHGIVKEAVGDHSLATARQKERLLSFVMHEKPMAVCGMKQGEKNMSWWLLV